MRQVQIYVDIAAPNVNAGCDCLEITYKLAGQFPVKVNVGVVDIYNGKNRYSITIDSKVFKLWWHQNMWNFIYEQDGDDEEVAIFEEDTQCPFGVYDVVNLGSSGLTFDSFSVGVCQPFLYEKLELFEDEQIQINSSVQNIADISKVFTDFSQSFTVPASTHNNTIFEHFYQSDVDSSIDHNIRRNAIIEIDLTTFRRGKIQIEKANIKNGLVENYQITFYGEVRTLKDAFGEDKLNLLNLTPLEFQFTAANIYNRITDLATNYDVRYPLIASNRLWAYQSSGEDVTNTSHAIQYDELFPAVKVSKLFEAIESQYGLTFQGTFLSDPRFTNVFLYGKNAIEYQFLTATSNVLLDQIVTTLIQDPTLPNPSDLTYVNIYEDEINIIEATGAINHIITFDVQNVSASGTFYIEVYQDGNYYQTLQGDSNVIIGFVSIQNTSGLNTSLTFKMKATNTMNVDILLTYQIQGFNSLTNYAQISTVQTVLTGNVSLNNTLPDIKVSDFFAGVLKEFNMTCVGISENTFEILPLDDWYQEGAIVDITEYTDIDSIDVERIKLYKKIAFKYQQSESFVNRQFFKLANTEYGNTEYQFAYDGDEYNIEVPFENLLFTRATKTGDPTRYAIFGYNLNENYQAYIPKPTLLYLYGQSNSLSAHPIKFYNGAGHDNITSFAQFGQDLTYQNTKYSLNFGAENSVIHLETIQQGLYAEYYFSYLLNLFNLKNRLTYVKTNLPISLLTSLRLNDRLIIRDKSYIINEMKSNLTTGEVNFSLYLDFRPITSGKIYVPSFDAQSLNIPINLVNGAVSATITTTFGGVTITPSTITSSQNVVVSIPENTNTPSFILAENSDPIITEEFQNLVTENSSVQVIILTITYTLSDGSTVVQTQTILQQ